MKKATAFLLSFILIISLTLPVSAAKSTAFLSDRYDVSVDALYCYGKQLPAGGTLSVSSGSSKVENAIFSTLNQEQVPVTVYCLVDISSSLPDSIKQQQKDILLTLSSQMDPQDNMVLGFIDKSLTEGKPLSDKDTRDTAINTIQRQNWYTNLYQGISQAMDSICSNTSYHTNRCLIILSDGHDDGMTNVTADHVLEKIKAADIPVYSIMLTSVGSAVNQKDLRAQEQFTSESLGGMLSQPLAEGISAATAAGQIWDTIKGSTAIRIALEELQDTQSDQELLIRYEVGNTRFEDTILIRAVDLPVPPAEAASQPATETAAVNEENGNDKDEEDTQSDEKDLLDLLPVVGVAALLLAAAVVLFALLKKKKPSQEDAVQEQDASIPAYDAAMFVQDTINNYSNGKNSDFGSVVSSEAPKTAPVVGDCHIYAVALMHPEITADFWVSPKVETTFGRSDKAAIQLCSMDKKLSGVHGSLLWDGKMLFVRDKNSRNGTAVNGEPCCGETWLRIEDGATLRAGAYEYRINFRVHEEKR